MEAAKHRYAQGPAPLGASGTQAVAYVSLALLWGHTAPLATQTVCPPGNTKEGPKLRETGHVGALMGKQLAGL